MKTIKIFFVTVLACIASVSSFSQSLDEIVSKHIEAIGGKENWEKIKSIKMEGSMKMQGSEIKISILQVDDKATRQNITVMGMTGYSIITTTEGWSFMPFQGQTKPEPITAEDLKNSQDQLNIQEPFINYAELGKKLEFIGKEDVDGVECFKIKMTDKNDQVVTYFIDPDNYYIIKQIGKVKSNGKEFDNIISFGNYKKLDEGIVYPMSVGGGFGATEIVKLEINTPIDESEFKVQI